LTVFTIGIILLRCSQAVESVAEVANIRIRSQTGVCCSCRFRTCGDALFRVYVL